MQVHANGGILSESEYPYAAGTSCAAGKCRASDPSVQPAVTITGYVDLPGGVTLLSSLREVRSKHGRDNCVTAVGGAIRELAAGPQKGASLSLQLES